MIHIRGYAGKCIKFITGSLAKKTRSSKLSKQHSNNIRNFIGCFGAILRNGTRIFAKLLEFEGVKGHSLILSTELTKGNFSFRSLTIIPERAF